MSLGACVSLYQQLGAVKKIGLPQPKEPGIMRRATFDIVVRKVGLVIEESFIVLVGAMHANKRVWGK